MSILTEREFLPIGRCKDISGQKFGKLTAIGLVEARPHYGAIWLFRCECGGEKEVRAIAATRGMTSSCGCIRPGIAADPVVKGKVSRLYSIWHGMKSRCTRPSEPAYKNYGERGISVCKEWAGKHSFAAFRAWALSNGYADSLSIDRIDNDKGYGPENCRWANRETQANNRRSNAFVTAWGETKTVSQWSRDDRCKTSRRDLHERISNNRLSPEDAISLPAGALMLARLRLITAWSETKTLTEWSKDDRCVVKLGVIVSRIDRSGMSPEKAIGSPVGSVKPLHPAWGESKTALGWSKDDRCAVNYHTILRRLANGTPPEDAISTPANRKKVYPNGSLENPRNAYP